MGTLHNQSDVDLALYERSAIIPAYGVRSIDLLDRKSVVRTYGSRDCIEPPNQGRTVGILASGWVLTQQRLGSAKIILDTSLPYDPIVTSLNDIAGRKKMQIARTPCRIFWLNFEDVFELARRDAEFRMKTYSKINRLRRYSDERLRVATHFGATARLALFILQTLERLKESNPKIYDRFLCPLSQSELGALLGMTNIHVSRSLSRMEANGEIKRHKSFIEIVNASALSAHFT